MRINPSGVAIIVLALIAGYSFGGTIGLGISSILMLITQVI